MTKTTAASGKIGAYALVDLRGKRAYRWVRQAALVLLALASPGFARGEPFGVVPELNPSQESFALWAPNKALAAAVLRTKRVGPLVVNHEVQIGYRAVDVVSVLPENIWGKNKDFGNFGWSDSLLEHDRYSFAVLEHRWIVRGGYQQCDRYPTDNRSRPAEIFEAKGNFSSRFVVAKYHPVWTDDRSFEAVQRFFSRDGAPARSPRGNQTGENSPPVVSSLTFSGFMAVSKLSDRVDRDEPSKHGLPKSSVLPPRIRLFGLALGALIGLLLWWWDGYRKDDRECDR